jgi:hypothetical protein
MAVATLAAAGCGCRGPGGVRNTRVTPSASRPVAKQASQQELLDKYNLMAQGVNTINATMQLKLTAGSQYSGVIEEYHEVKAFLLAKRPSAIRMIGQVPVIGTTVFDMASNGTSFEVWIPSKNKFLTGAVAIERQSEKPVENLRPQHLLDALLWPPIRKEEAVLFEEYNDDTGRYYVLTLLRGGYQTEILRKVWFDRSNLQVSRLEDFAPKGVLLSDAHFSDWQPVAPAGNGVTPANASAPAQANAVDQFPRMIRIDRPRDDYRLDLQIMKISLNEELPEDRFILEQPAGSELVRVGEDPGNKKR